MDATYYRCIARDPTRPCNWFGTEDEAIPMRDLDVMEYWGAFVNCSSIEYVCPECNGELVECAPCQSCHQHPADVDDECRNCIVSDYLVGVEDFAADQQLYADKPWWPQVERWVVAEIKKRSDKRANDFNAVLVDIARIGAIGLTRNTIETFGAAI